MIQRNIDQLADTKALAETVAAHLNPGICVALDGDLGAGKTTFVKYCAEALGLRDTVDSPTFTILKTYGPPKLHHMDAYRIGPDSEDLDDALDDSDAYIFCEWASRIESRLPVQTIFIKFTHTDDHKVLTFDGNGVIDEDIFSD